MTFINEYVSDEDIRKYRLDDLWDRTHPRQPWRGTHRHSWTIDRNRNTYLMLIRSGREMKSANRFEFLLWWDGNEIYLDLEREGNANFRTGEGSGKWHLRNPHQLASIDAAKSNEIAAALKAALLQYGFSGVEHQLKNYVVHTAF
jgi:hypothetical protein